MGPKEEAQPEEIDTGDEPESIVDLDTDFEDDTDSETETDTEVSTDTETLTDTELNTQINWITITGGSYLMGRENYFSYTIPVHTVNVPTFDMMEAEVTVAQYADCVANGPCTPPSTDEECSPLETGNWGAQGFEYHPINCVSFQQATDFCQWVGGRLPSESEWEYAARSGGQDIDNPWGDGDVDCHHAITWHYQSDGCGTGHTWPVCSKPMGNSVHGLCDMVGNVWNWTQDYFHWTYEGAPDDGSPWLDPGASLAPIRAKRGGASFNWGAQGSYSRSGADENYGFDHLGFRCAR